MINTTIAHYQITSKLGQGGMGAVYRATDTKLDREVAIKVLPESFAQDRERLARFEREAKVLASLNHPNIAAIHGLEQTGNSHALVLELVEGEDLSERLKRGPLPVEEALDVCKQIAEALEAAHEKGIIHRDLKPGNVKLTAEGKVKVLDFGLAKTATTESTSISPDSPTITADHTLPGTLLGTAGYMSPEQARGKAVDKRSDIWSFGVVLFECLTGKRLFTGESVTDSIGALLHKEIDWSQLPPNTPPTVQLLLRKCLARDRKRRLPDIGAARLDLEQAIADPSSSFIRLGGEALQETNARTGRPRLVIGGLVLVAALATGALIWISKPSAPLPSPARVEVVLSRDREPFAGWGIPFALSKDGTKLAYMTGDAYAQNARLHVKDLSPAGPQEIEFEDTETAYDPFISANGEYIGFFQSGALRSVSSLGGKPRKVADLASPGIRGLGATWNEDGTIVYAQDGSGLMKVPASGGSLESLTQLAPGDHAHLWPQFLPDGRHVLYSVGFRENGEQKARIEVVDTVSGEPPRTLIPKGGNARYAASGHLIYWAGGLLCAIRFDPDKLELIGSEVPLWPVSVNHYAIAEKAGTLVYVPERQTGFTRLVWVTAGGEINPVRMDHEARISYLALSSDGRQAALSTDKANSIMDLETGVSRRLTDNQDEAAFPCWSGDGSWMVYASHRDGGRAFWRRKADWSGEPEPMVSGANGGFPLWARDS